MKTLKLQFFLLAAFLVMNRASAQTASAQQMVIPLSDPAKTYTLEAHLHHGFIKVSSYDGKEIIVDVHADTSNDRGDDEGENGMKRIPGGGGLDVKAEEDNNTVRIDAGLSKRLIGINVKVPAQGGKLKLSTVLDGDIEVTNFTGEIEVNDINNDITLTGISGSVEATSVNGSLTVGFKKVDPAKTMAFSTLNGKVDVTFPADIHATLKLKTDNGQMYTDFEIPADETKPRVNKSMDNHTYRINIDDWVNGKINGGGQEITMKTFNGDIYIRKAK